MLVKVKFSELTADEKNTVKSNKIDVYYDEDKDINYVYAEETIFGLVFRDPCDSEQDNYVHE